MYIRNKALSSLFKLIVIGFVVYGLAVALSDGGAHGLRYFTVQSNVLVGAVAVYLLAGVLLVRPEGWAGRLSAYLRGLTMLAISLTGIVFNVMLAPAIDGPLGFDSIALHTIVPVGFVLDWLLFARKGSFRFPHVAVWVAPPLAYVIITLAVATWDGFYPYPFMDAAEAGYGMVAVNILVLMVAFSVLGAFYVAVDKLMARRAALGVPREAGAPVR